MARIAARAAKQIRQLQAMEAILLDRQFAENVRGTGVVGRPVVGVAVAGDLHRTGNVAEFQDIGQLVGEPFSPLITCCTRIAGSVGRPNRSDATSTHHSSPFLGLELEHIHVRRRIKPARDVAGQADPLGMGAIVVGLDFG